MAEVGAEYAIPGSWQEAGLLAAGARNDLTLAILDHSDDPFSSDALEDYVRTAAGMGGAAACTALGAPVLAPVCSRLGGWIAGVILDSFAKGAGYDELVSDTIDRWITPSVAAGNRNVLAFRTYLTLRAAAIETLAQQTIARTGAEPDAARQWVDETLEQAGVRRKAFPGDAERFAEASRRLQEMERRIGGRDAQCEAADRVGVGCRAYYEGLYFPLQLITGPEEDVDWGIVAGGWFPGAGSGPNPLDWSMVEVSRAMTAALEAAAAELAARIEAGTASPGLLVPVIGTFEPRAGGPAGAGTVLIGAGALLGLVLAVRAAG